MWLACCGEQRGIVPGVLLLLPAPSAIAMTKLKAACDSVPTVTFTALSPRLPLPHLLRLIPSGGLLPTTGVSWCVAVSGGKSTF